MRYFVLNMKYMCKSCKKPCNDIIEHVKKVHGFSESYINDCWKTNSNSYLHGFEEIEQVRNMRKHEINKIRKVKQNRRSSAKSQVSKKHERKSKNKQAHRK